MEALILPLLMYGIGMTIAFFCVLKSRNRYVSKSEFLTRKIAEMQEMKDGFAPRIAPPAQVTDVQANTVTNEAPKPAPVQIQKPEPKERKLTAIGVSFAVGVLLLVISAAVFISATWHTLAPGIKCIVLMGVVATVYGLSAFSRKKLDLEKTGSGLFVLGNLLVPMAIIVGFMEIGRAHV